MEIQHVQGRISRGHRPGTADKFLKFTASVLSKSLSIVTQNKLRQKK